jgi:hypothetical protein
LEENVPIKSTGHFDPLVAKLNGVRGGGLCDPHHFLLFRKENYYISGNSLDILQAL